VKERLEQESKTIDEESFEIDHEADSTVRTTGVVGLLKDPTI